MASRGIQVGIAVVEQQGRYLVGTRGDEGPLPGYAEFPGGKCEPGEPSADCACRECFEETGLRVVPVERLLNRTFEYAHGPVDLDFWLCRPAGSGDVAESHQGYRWVSVDQLGTLRFPEANGPVLEKLLARSTRPE